jgi:RNA polymerase sigma factor (sigma-70 family)
MSAVELVLHHQVGAMYSDHHSWLQSWLRKKIGCSHRAADMAQDTFIRILTSRVPSQLAEPRAYITTVAKHLVADHWRRQELERAYLDALAYLSEPEAPSPEDQLLILQSLQRIDASLQALPAVTRRVFLLSQLDGLPYADIAIELMLSLSTVKRHMSRAFMACLMVA